MIWTMDNFQVFSRSIDDSATTIGVLNFKTITMHMKEITRNKKKAASRVDAARKSWIWKIGM